MSSQSLIYNLAPQQTAEDFLKATQLIIKDSGLSNTHPLLVIPES